MRPRAGSYLPVKMGVGSQERRLAILPESGVRSPAPPLGNLGIIKILRILGGPEHDACSDPPEYPAWGVVQNASHSGPPPECIISWTTQNMRYSGWSRIWCIFRTTQNMAHPGWSRIWCISWAHVVRNVHHILDHPEYLIFWVVQNMMHSGGGPECDAFWTTPRTGYSGGSRTCVMFWTAQDTPYSGLP